MYFGGEALFIASRARAQRSVELGENAEQKGGGVKSSISPAWYPGTCVTFERKSEFTAFLRGRALCFFVVFFVYLFSGLGSGIKVKKMKKGR